MDSHMEIRQQVQDSLRKLDDFIEQKKRAMPDTQPNIDNSAGNQGKIVINLHAGKVSTWVASAVGLLILAFFSGAALTSGWWFSREFSKIDTAISELHNTDDVHDAYINKLRAEQKKEKP